MSRATEELVNALSYDEIASLRAGLIRKLKEDARSMAVPMASALVAELRVMGMTEEAAAVKDILDAICKWRAP